MTTASVPIAGVRRLIGLKPADTNEATMLTAGEERPVIVGIIISNNTGGGVAATVKWGDGSTDYDVISAKSVGANDTLYINEIFLPLRSSYTIKVTSATGNALTFTLVVIDYVGSFGGEHAH